MTDTQTVEPDVHGGPIQADVDALRYLLDLTAEFGSDQRARYLLSCNWMIERGSVASSHARAGLIDTITRTHALATDDEALTEVAWVCAEARTLLEEHVDPTSVRWVTYRTRKQNLLTYVDGRRSS